MYRQFSVTNARGVSFDMTRADAFFESIKGLGTKNKSSYTMLGNSFALLSKETAQKSPQGTMSFSGYKVFDEFYNVIKYCPVTLKYVPYEGNELYMDCDTYEITKGERDKTGRLNCPIKFYGASTWYKKNQIYKNESTGQGKIYSYSYPYTYIENRVGTLSFENESNLEAYVRLTIIGPTKNPYWMLLQNNKIIMEGKVNVQILQEQRIVINADPLKYEIAIYDIFGNKIEDIYEKSDFGTQRFIYLPSGKSVLSCSHESDEKISIWAEVRENVE